MTGLKKRSEQGLLTPVAGIGITRVMSYKMEDARAVRVRSTVRAVLLCTRYRDVRGIIHSQTKSAAR